MPLSSAAIASTHRRREAIGVRLVRVPLEAGRQLELVLDSVQARRDHGREREVRVRVAAGDSRLGPARRPVADDPEPTGAVVVPPRERRRRPGAGCEPLVRVDRRREEHRELLEARDLTREPAREERLVGREARLAVAPQRGVDVTGVADPVLERLRHERDRAPVEERDLLGAVLVDDVVVRHRQRVGEAEVDLLLARPRLALRRLDAHAGGLHPVPDLAQERLVVGRGEDVVIEDVRHRRRQARVLLLVRLLERLAEEIELELAAHHRREAERGGALELGLQDLARRGLHRRPVVPLHVAENERRRLEPRDAAEGGQVGPDVEVAVALLPARERVAGHRVHLHLEREQVVAPLHSVPRVHLLEEELGVEALAHQPPLHVGEGDDDGVDRAGLDLCAQLLVAQHRGDPILSGRGRILALPRHTR